MTVSDWTSRFFFFSFKARCRSKKLMNSVVYSGAPFETCRGTTAVNNETEVSVTSLL